MISIVRKFSIDVGHRVLGHEGKCSNVHGHTYTIEVHARGPELDGIGRVIDFSALKDRIGSWLDACWDHGFVVNAEDEAVHIALTQLESKFFLLPFNPTAENMAEYLLRRVCPERMEGTGIEVFRVVVHETPNCRAEATL
jgi:6-pyruvoyltetrahydropterin/6-carboxytetrahydropterin synthase